MEKGEEGDDVDLVDRENNDEPSCNSRDPASLPQTSKGCCDHVCACNICHPLPRFVSSCSVQTVAPRGNINSVSSFIHNHKHMASICILQHFFKQCLLPCPSNRKQR
ncbi:hypothetical protein ElyMa_005709700 [Elysia marginata]|uniref:Uncharacterized protein n=1 Tax=Elysia marginata TaxID=1093978 RepID=A0AAV4FIS6_9GAST|nr:hypothetical protein ElyMa_005709700 [Elysia marginata]